MNAIDVHYGVARTQAVRIEYLDKRSVVGFDQLCRDRDVAVTARLGLQLAEREPRRILAVQRAQVVRNAGVIHVRTHRPGAGGVVARAEREREHESQATHESIHRDPPPSSTRAARCGVTGGGNVD